MSSWDDDDWTGTPPEGRHSSLAREPRLLGDNRAPLSITGAGVGIALIILVDRLAAVRARAARFRA